MASFIFIPIVIGIFAIALSIWYVIRRLQVGRNDVDRIKSMNTSLSATLKVITIVLGVVMASFFLLFGVANLISPDVPDNYLDQNSLICVIIILAGVVSIYTLIRPYSGGILLCIFALFLGCFMVYSITVLILVFPILLLGVLSVIRGRFARQKASE